MKDILITGAWGGMGRATALAMRDRGYRVFALDLRVGEAEQGIIPIEADITSSESIKAALRARTLKTMIMTIARQNREEEA